MDANNGKIKCFRDLDGFIRDTTTLEKLGSWFLVDNSVYVIWNKNVNL